jgi:hypothetical protein
MKRALMKGIIMGMVLLSGLNVAGLYAQSTTQQPAEVFSEVYNVNDFKVINDSLMVIYDPGRKGQEISLINSMAKEVVGSTRIGKGPGEISGKMIRIFVDRNQQRIHIFDYEQVSITTFDYQFNVTNEQVLEVEGPPLLTAIPVSDSRILVQDMGRANFARLYDLDQRKELNSYPFENEGLDYLQPVQANPLMKQGVICYGSNYKSIIYTTEYSSILIRMTEQGYSYLTLGSPNLPYPEYEVEDAVMAVPSTDEYTFSTLDLSVNERRIYILHSGKEAGTMKSMWAVVRGKIDQLMSELERSDQLLVYDETTGNYQKTLTLPFETKLAKVYHNRIYMLKETEQGEQFIVAFGK